MHNPTVHSDTFSHLDTIDMGIHMACRQSSLVWLIKEFLPSFSSTSNVWMQYERHVDLTNSKETKKKKAKDNLMMQAQMKVGPIKSSDMLGMFLRCITLIAHPSQLVGMKIGSGLSRAPLLELEHILSPGIVLWYEWWVSKNGILVSLTNWHVCT